MDNLREYIRQMMRVKNLKAVDIQANSGGKITDAYISDILSGKTKRIGAEKIQALADGLGVDSIEVFKVVVNYNEKHSKDPWPSSLLLRAMQQIIHNPELTKVVHALLKMKPSKVKAVLAFIESKKD